MVSTPASLHNTIHVFVLSRLKSSLRGRISNWPIRAELFSERRGGGDRDSSFPPPLFFSLLFHSTLEAPSSSSSHVSRAAGVEILSLPTADGRGRITFEIKRFMRGERRATQSFTG